LQAPADPLSSFLSLFALAPADPLSSFLSLFALALIAPLLGFTLFAASRMIAKERADGEEQLRRTATMLSAVIDRELTDLIETLQALAGSGSLRDGDFAGFHRDASVLLLGTADAILLVDRDLRQIVNTRVPHGTALPQISDTDTARKVLATGKPAIGHLVIDRLAQRPAVKLMVPAIVEGEVRYVLALSPEPAMLIGA
jgi:hypothetical protein